SLSRLISSIKPPFALFIDSANADLDTSLLDALRVTPETLAAGVSLFWASRRSFTFADEKLMLDERVHTFDFSDLLFSGPEADSFLRQRLGHAFSQRKLDKLIDFAGGWPAILALLSRNTLLLEAIDESPWPAAVF